MHWPGGLEFLEQARATPLFLVNDSVFVPASAEGKMVMRRRVSLAAQAKVLAAHPQVLAGPAMPVSERAREYLSSLDELNFVVRELLPYLRFLVSEDESCLHCSDALSTALTQLSRQGAALRDMLGRPLEFAVPGGLLTTLFAVPCAVMGEIVIPMERTDRLSQPMGDIEIEGVYYRLRVAHFRRLQPVIAEVSRTLARLVQGVKSGDRRVDGLAVNWLRELQRILHSVGLRPAGPDYLVYRDRHHELHCRQGHFVLARGPILSDGARGTTYVGLAIKGKSRQQRLAVCPAVAYTPQKLWTAVGTPVQGGICMGNRTQYRRLLSHQFTDAEATVHWLDAGVRITTGASALHRRLLRAPRQAVRRAQAVRR